MNLPLRTTSRLWFLVAFLFIIGSFPVATLAQSAFEDGYIVEASGDTLRGFVQFDAGPPTAETLRFRPSANAPVQTRSGMNTIGFGTAEREFERHPVTIDQRPTQPERDFPSGDLLRRDTVFLEKLVEGSLTLYHYHDRRKHLYLAVDGGRPNELVHYVQEVQRNGRTYLAESERYREQLNEARTSDCPRTARGLRYTVASIVEYVRACNGSEGRDLSKQLVERTRFRLDHQVHLRPGRMDMTLTKADSPTLDVSGRSIGFGYTLMLRPNRPSASMGLLLNLGLRWFEGDRDGLRERTATNVRRGETYSVVYTGTARAEGVALRVGLGGRYRVRTDASTRPFVEFGFRGLHAISYDVSFAQEQLWTPQSSPDGETITETVYTETYEWPQTQFGGRIGLGLEWKAWAVQVDAERQLFVRAGGSVGDDPPRTRTIGMSMSYQF